MFGSKAIAQNQPDTTELITFWETQVTYLINKDTTGLSQTIDYPVTGLWAMFFALGEPQKQWGKDEFFGMLDSLLPRPIITSLKNQTYRDVEIHIIDGVTELWVLANKGIEVSDDCDDCETALYFCYSKLGGVWKLWSVQIVG